jgi:hypothetical protein
MLVPKVVIGSDVCKGRIMRGEEEEQLLKWPEKVGGTFLQHAVAVRSLRNVMAAPIWRQKQATSVLRKKQERLQEGTFAPKRAILRQGGTCRRCSWSETSRENA